MPTPTYDLLDSVTISTSTSSITFTSIPQTYRDLVLVTQAPSGSSVTYVWYAFFNGDTSTSNYPVVRAYGTGSATASSTTTQQGFGTLGTSNPTSAITHIMDYSATDKHKTWLSRSNNQDAVIKVNMVAGRWTNTAAITSMEVQVAGNLENYQLGTTIYLYGVAA